MAKKSRRAKAKHRAKSTEVVRVRHPQQPRTIPAELQSPPRVSPRVQDSASQYQYVLPEIKRIGIIAGLMILVLIILYFVLG